MQTKWKFLRVVATLYRVFGALCLLAGVISLVGAIYVGIGVGGATSELGQQRSEFGDVLPHLLGGAVGGAIFGFISAIAWSIWALILFSLAEVVYLAIAVEENTRQTALVLQAGPSVR